MSKFFNEDSARCLTCEGRLLPRGLAGNDKHLYTIGTLYKCRCGASSVWTNSIRNPVALLAFLDGTSTRYYQGFCNDLFDGKRGRTIMPFRSVDFPREMQRGQVYGYDDTDVAVVWSGRFWSEQVGPGELIEWYAKHADVIRRAVAAETSTSPHEAGRRNPAVVDEPGSPIAELAKKLDHRFLWSTRKASELVKGSIIRFLTDRGAEPTAWKVITHPKHDRLDIDAVVMCQIKSLHDGTIRKREYWFPSEEVYVDV